MDDMAEAAKRLLILQLYRGWPGADRNLNADTEAGYLDALHGFDVEAVKVAVMRFIGGEVERSSHSFPPSAPELAIQARRWQHVIDQRGDGSGPKLIPYPLGGPVPEGLVPLGPTKVDFGRGTIDMTDMTAAEKEEVLRNKGLPAPDAQKVIPQMRRMR